MPTVSFPICEYAALHRLSRLYTCALLSGVNLSRVNERQHRDAAGFCRLRTSCCGLPRLIFAHLEWNQQQL